MRLSHVADTGLRPHNADGNSRATRRGGEDSGSPGPPGGIRGVKVPLPSADEFGISERFLALPGEGENAVGQVAPFAEFSLSRAFLPAPAYLALAGGEERDVLR